VFYICITLKITDILNSMTADGIPAEMVETQLERVLASPGFARNERLSRFLRFIAQEELNGRGSEIKESLIGVEVFGRKPGFDPKQDSSVRSEAAKLRARLAEYYDAEGKDDSLIIEIPKGGYIPRFRCIEQNPARDVRQARRFQLWHAALAAGLALALAAGSFWLWKRGTGPVSIAVLPLTNLSSDSANDFFVDGITDEIIRNLSILDGLAVRSQTSSFAFKGKPHNVHEIGRQLNVDYILEGSVLRAGQQLRINAQLIRVRDDFPLWSGRYDRQLSDVFAIQDELSRNIVNQLRLKLGRGRRRYETSAEAYDCYLRARALENSGLSGREASVDPFQQAIARDVSFAPAYAGLAAAYVVRSGDGGHRPGRDEEMAVMQATAEKAIELDPLLAEAHAALGMTYARVGQWRPAEQRFRRAIDLDANSATTRTDFAMSLLLPLGRVDDAVREMRAAERADPISSAVHIFFGYALLAAGRYEEAARQCEKASADDPVRSECVGRARTQQGKFGEAIPLLAHSTNDWGFLAYAYAKAGRRADADKLTADAPTLYPHNRGGFQYALAFAGLGDREQTLAQLERMVNLGPVRLGRDLTYPEFALVRGDPRVKALRKKVGLPE
jgi:TolB-like protein/Flp pilus assembly protein TadD